MDINSLTIGEIKQIQTMFKCDSQDHPFEIGKPYFIRTVTHHLTGRLVAVYKTELVLEDAAWIADDGRFNEVLKTCDFSEIEPFPDGKVIVGRGALIDMQVIDKTPRSLK